MILSKTFHNVKWAVLAIIVRNIFTLTDPQMETCFFVFIDYGGAQSVKQPMGHHPLFEVPKKYTSKVLNCLSNIVNICKLDVRSPEMFKLRISRCPNFGYFCRPRPFLNSLRIFLKTLVQNDQNLDCLVLKWLPRVRKNGLIRNLDIYCTLNNNQYL